TGGGATTLPDGTLNLGKGSRGGTTSSGGTLQLSGQQQNATGSTLVPSPRAASTPAEKNPGPGGTPSSKDPGPGGNPSLRDPGPGGIPLQQISGGFVPKMPPMASNPKRDAAPPADTSTKEQIKSQIKAQLAAAISRIPRPTSQALMPAASNAPEIQVLRSQKMFVDSLRSQSGPTKGALIAAQAPPLLVGNQPSATPNPMLRAPQPNQICIAPQVHAVNGKTSGVIFTQDPTYNDYIITGCGFGSQPGPVYLSGAVTGGRINLVVKPGQWSDTQIEAMVLPGLTGVLDGWPDLIVTAANGSSAKFP